MLNPHFVAGEHGLFGGHESKDIPTIFSSFSKYKIVRTKCSSLYTMLKKMLVTHFEMKIVHRNMKKSKKKCKWRLFSFFSA